VNTAREDSKLSLHGTSQEEALKKALSTPPPKREESQG
jgi:hypothetical protein